MATFHFTDAGTLLVSARGVNDATALMADLLSGRRGREYIVQHERRGGRVREFPGLVVVEISQPHRRITALHGRKANPWVTLAEFPWLLAGRADVEWLEPYLPRASEFSDDGKNWRAGYGPRLRCWGGDTDQIDQLAKTVELLRNIPTTRQAVISLWDPEVDLNADPVERSRDYPCTNWMHFQMDGGGRLDLTVAMRSNDLMWGFSGVNVFNFTMLQWLVATVLGVDVGTYRHVCDNMHVYERHIDRLSRVARSWDLYDLIYNQEDDGRPGYGTSLRGFTAAANRVLACVERLRYDTSHVLTDRRELQNAAVGYDWLTDWGQVMLLHNRRLSPAKLFSLFTQDLRHREDWCLAVAGWLARRYPEEGYRELVRNLADHCGVSGREDQLVQLLLDEPEQGE